MRVKISVIMGTRPEAIKLAPVIVKLRESDWCACRVCVTAQHRQMLDQVLEVFGISPDADLDLMAPGQSLSGLTSRSVSAIDDYLHQERSDLVIVQGDTTTVLCAALAAFYLHIPVAHVEAGLRTWNLDCPFPEEANRVLVSRLASLHFAPTECNRSNLLKEGVASACISVTGNTVVDALFATIERVRRQRPRVDGLSLETLERIAAAGAVLVTGHRRENLGAGLDNVCRALRHLALRYKSIQFVFPIHLNPAVRASVSRVLGENSCDNLHLVDPLPYPAFVWLLDKSRLVISDSGGVQEEAPSLGKTVLVTRDVTERPEAIASGFTRIVGTSFARIVEEAEHALGGGNCDNRPPTNAYGDGNAATRVVAVCRDYLARSANRAS
jgi:UDP-N-acetylglucosamine 2-epimerase (non-hydrolysing)